MPTQPSPATPARTTPLAPSIERKSFPVVQFPDPAKSENGGHEDSKMEPAVSEWLTATESAQYLKVKPRTVMKWAKEGRIPGRPLSGRNALHGDSCNRNCLVCWPRHVLLNSGVFKNEQQNHNWKRGRNKHDKVWRFYWWERGKRKSKVLGRFSTQSKAWAAAKPYRDDLESRLAAAITLTLTLPQLVEHYRLEKMPTRASTRRGYEVYFRKHILPKWQHSEITELQARPVELWLKTLALAPKSKVHIRGLLHTLWDYAM
jgi:hypothetical protein